MKVYEPGDPAPDFPDAEYPELERQKWARDERNSQQLGDFLGWLLTELDLHLVTDDQRAPPPMESLLAMYFGIDLAQVERERQQILAKL